MPKVKDANLRYRIIDKQLKGGGVKTVEQLMQACEDILLEPVCKRTIEGDINAMRNDTKLGYLAPIKNERGVGYSYTDRFYTISEFPLNDDELNIISKTSSILKQFNDVPLFGEFAATADRMMDVVKFSKEKRGDLSAYIDFEKAVRQEGNHHLKRLLEAIIDKQPLQVKYSKFTGAGTQQYIVHPYLLKEYRNRWYLVGYSTNSAGIRCFGLDRIEKITHESTKFIRMPFSVSSYYKDVVGISVIADEAVEIQIAFTPGQVAYLLTQPLHHTQRAGEKLPDGRQMFTFKLIPNYEFYAQVLAWGDSAEVLSPPKVRKEVMNRVEQIYNSYRRKTETIEN